MLVTQWGAWRELSTPVYAGSTSQSLRHLYAKCSPLLGSSATPGPGGAGVAQGGLVTSPAVTSLCSPGLRALQRPADCRTRDHLGQARDHLRTSAWWGGVEPGGAGWGEGRGGWGGWGETSWGTTSCSGGAYLPQASHGAAKETGT